MNHNSGLMIRLAIILIAPMFLSFQENEWRLDKNKNEVKVYTREIEGFQVRQFKVESHTSASITRIDDLLRNISEYESWMPDVTSAKILEQPDENTYIYHMTINSPFPVNDRDLVTKMTFAYPTENSLRITYEGLPDYYPEQDKHVRISHFRGFWEFTETGDETVIRNQFLTDPSGSIPSWVINSFMASNPYNTVIALKKEIE